MVQILFVIFCYYVSMVYFLVFILLSRIWSLPPWFMYCIWWAKKEKNTNWNYSAMKQIFGNNDQSITSIKYPTKIYFANKWRRHISRCYYSLLISSDIKLQRKINEIKFSFFGNYFTFPSLRWYTSRQYMQCNKYMCVWT